MGAMEDIGVQEDLSEAQRRRYSDNQRKTRPAKGEPGYEEFVKNCPVYPDNKAEAWRIWHNMKKIIHECMEMAQYEDGGEILKILRDQIAYELALGKADNSPCTIHDYMMPAFDAFLKECIDKNKEVMKQQEEMKAVREKMQGAFAGSLVEILMAASKLR